MGTVPCDDIRGYIALAIIHVRLGTQKRTFSDNWSRFLQGRGHSCHQRQLSALTATRDNQQMDPIFLASPTDQWRNKGSRRMGAAAIKVVPIWRCALIPLDAHQRVAHGTRN